MIIDTHQHFWKYDPTEHSWIDDNMKVIRRDFLPEDLKPVLERNEIEGCIAVQAEQSESENDFLLDLAKENDFIKGIIGWVNFKSVDIEERLDYYSAFSRIKGFRHIVQGEEDPNFLLRSDFLKGVSKLQNYGYVYEILVFPHQLGAVLEFVRKFPNQLFVLNHIGKPYIKDGFMDGWKALVSEISKSQNVYCKISGIITEADYKKWSYKQLEPYLELIIDQFGIKRIMFGSDWPVCLVAGEYSNVKAVAEIIVKSFSVDEQDAFWRKNAIRLYKL